MLHNQAVFYNRERQQVPETAGFKFERDKSVHAARNRGEILRGGAEGWHVEGNAIGRHRVIFYLSLKFVLQIF